MSGVNNFSGKCQGKTHNVVVSKEKSNTIVGEKLLTTEKVTTHEEVDNSPKKIDGMKEVVVTIPRKDLYNFQGQSKGSTGWFNLNHEFLRRNVSSLEPDFCFLLLRKGYLRSRYGTI